MAEGGIPSEEVTQHATAEGETRPPKNVRVGLLFQAHEIEHKRDVLPTKKRLKDFFIRTFSKGQKNIFLSEDAYSDEHSQKFRDDSEEGFKRYGSFRAASVYAELKGRFEKILKDQGLQSNPANFQKLLLKIVPNFDNDIRKLVKEKEKEALTAKNPAAAYVWLEYQVLDELLTEGYDIQRIYEKGAKEKVEFEGKWNFYKFQEKLKKIAEHVNKRDDQICEQLTALVEKAKSEPDEVNIAGLFGTNHQTLVNRLPKRIRLITDTSYSTPIEDHPLNKVQLLLMKGLSIAEIPDELWHEANKWSENLARAPKPKGFSRFLSYIRRT